MPTKFTETTQTVSVPAPATYRLCVTNPSYGECHPSGACVERRASPNSTYNLERPSSPFGHEEGIPLRWYRRQYHELVWVKSPSQPDTNLEIPHQFRRIVYTNGRHRTNRCTHLKLKLSPGPQKPVDPTNNWFGCGGSARRYRTTATFGDPYPPSLRTFWDLLTEQGRKTQFVEVSFGDLTESILNPHKQELLNFLGELNQLPSLLQGVSRNARLLKQGIGRVRTIIRGLPIRNPVKAAKAFPKHVASAYLELQFGYKPVADDLAKVIAFTGTLRSHLRDLIDKNGKLRRVVNSRSGSRSSNFKIGNLEITSSTQWVSRSTVTVRTTIPGLTPIAGMFEDHFQTARYANILYRLTREYYGLSRTPRRLWDLVPLSFLVDQVIPVADWLNDLSSARMDIAYEPVYYSQTYKETTVYHYSNPSQGCNGTIELTYFVRKPGSLRLFTSRGLGSGFRRFSSTNTALAVQKLL